MAPLSHLKALQALEAAVRTGSLKAAAAELGITPAALGQRIKILEDYAGTTFLTRGSHGLSPRPALRDALADLTHAFQRLDQAAERLGLKSVNTVAIRADADWLELWLKPRLPDFHAANPHIFIAQQHVTDHPADGAAPDVTVSFGSLADGAGTLLFHDYLLPVASRDIERRVKNQPQDNRLEGFPLLHLDAYAADPEALNWPRWVSRFGFRKTDASRGARYRRITHGLDAVRSDAGILICGLSLIMSELGAGHLTMPFGFKHGGWTSHAYRMTARPVSLDRSQCRKFVAWLASQAEFTRQSLDAATIA